MPESLGTVYQRLDAGARLWFDRPMSLDELRAALETLRDPLAVVGTLPASDLALVLADGTRLSPHAGDFVERLLTFAEPAPFGDGKATRLDPAVRSAQRILASDDLRIEGLELRALLPEIEAGLSPAERLTARLLDVHIYPKGGHFRRHKDTPRDEAMVGTLVVWLPVAHRGGALVLSDGTRKMTLTGEKDALRWAAFAGDVDHEVEVVEEGHRVTLAFTLALAGLSRETDAPTKTRCDPVLAAVRACLADETFLPEGGVLALGCARHVIVREGKTKLDLRSLRGVDRELFVALETGGYRVSVGAGLALLDSDAHPKVEPSAAPALAEEFLRLRRPVAPQDARGWGEQVTLDGPVTEEVTSLEDLLKTDVTVDAWQLVVRAHTAATFVHEADYSATGYFGNEHFETCFYAFAAIEISVGDLTSRGLGPPPVALRRVRHPKFGEGEVLSEDTRREEPVLEVRFADGSVKKLLRRYLAE